MRLALHLAVDWADARREGRSAALITYLTTDPKALGILGWVSSAITLLGFAIAIWQIRKVKRAADAARDAALGMVQRVRSRELFAKLGDADTHLEAARNQVARGERETAMLFLELACRSIIEAQEISRSLTGTSDELMRLSDVFAQLTEQVTTMPDPLVDNDEFIELRLRLRDASDHLQRIMAQSRYTYEGDGE
jgi:hypothetical protein